MKKEQNIDSLLSDLNTALCEIDDVNTLLDLYQTFENERFEFLDSHYKDRLSERIINKSIPLQEGDFFCAINELGKEVGYYQFIEGVNYFDSFHDLKIKLKNGEIFLGKIKDIGEDFYEFVLEDENTKKVKKEDVKEIYIEIVF